MPATEFLHAPWAAPQGVVSMLVEPPTVEPITVAEGKLRAGLDWATGDPREILMEGFIRAARQRVEMDTGLALLQQTRRVLVNVDTGGTWPMPAQTIPTQSITAEDGAPFFAVLPGAWSFPEPTSGSYLVVAGWPTVEALQAEAPLLVQAVGILVAHLATLGRDLAGLEEPFLIPMGYEEAIQPFRLQWVT